MLWGHRVDNTRILTRHALWTDKARRGLRSEGRSCKKADDGTTMRCFFGRKAASLAPIWCGGRLWKVAVGGRQSGEAGWPTYALPAIVWWILKNRLTICT